MDIECLYESGDYSTLIQVVNSINISRFTDEDKSRLYFWAAKAFRKLRKTSEAEKFSNLSHKIADILENRKQDLEDLKAAYHALTNNISNNSLNGFISNCTNLPGVETPSFTNNINLININNNFGNAFSNNFTSLGTNNFSSPNVNGSVSVAYNNYVSKLIAMINELPLKDSRSYVLEFLTLNDFSKVELIQQQKLFFFLPQLKNTDFITSRNYLLKSSLTSVHIFNSLSYKYTEEWIIYHRLKLDFTNLINKIAAKYKKKDNITFKNYPSYVCPITKNSDAFASKDLETANEMRLLKEISERLFLLEIKLTFEIGTAISPIHSFDIETVLPGQFSMLRNEYDNIKIMSYIENFSTAYDAAENIFFVRNTDGTVAKIHVHNNDSYYNYSTKKSNEKAHPAVEDKNIESMPKVSNIPRNNSESHLSDLQPNNLQLNEGRMALENSELINIQAKGLEHQQINIKEPANEFKNSENKDSITQPKNSGNSNITNEFKNSENNNNNQQLKIKIKHEKLHRKKSFYSGYNNLEDKLNIKANTNMLQFIQLINDNIKNHQLKKLGFNVSTVPISEFASVHFSPDSSVDYYLKMHMYRKKMNLSTLIFNYIEDRNKNVKNTVAFANAATLSKNFLKKEVVERLVDHNSFYLFKRSFINSYSSLACIQHFLGTNDISLHDTILESTSGNAFLSFYTGVTNRKLFIRPNIANLIGDEGMNGPLLAILSRFAENLAGSSNLITFFFGEDMNAEATKKAQKLVYNGTDDISNSQDAIVSDMIDPKNGSNLPVNTLSWI
jgi:hypothetical protein